MQSLRRFLALLLLGFAAVLVAAPAAADTSTTSVEMIVDEIDAVDDERLVKLINGIDNPAGYRVAVLVTDTPQIREANWEFDARSYVMSLGRPEIAGANGLNDDVILVVVLTKIRVVGVFAGDAVPITASMTEKAADAMVPDASLSDWEGSAFEGAKSILGNLNKGPGEFPKVLLPVAGVLGAGGLGTWAWWRGKKKYDAAQAEAKRRERLLAQPVPRGTDIASVHTQYLEVKRKARAAGDDGLVDRAEAKLNALAPVLNTDFTEEQRLDEKFMNRVREALNRGVLESLSMEAALANYEGDWESAWRGRFNESVGRLESLQAEIADYRASYPNVANDAEFDTRLQRMAKTLESLDAAVLAKDRNVNSAIRKLGEFDAELLELKKDYVRAVRTTDAKVGKRHDDKASLLGMIWQAQQDERRRQEESARRAQQRERDRSGSRSSSSRARSSSSGRSYSSRSSSSSFRSSRGFSGGGRKF